LARGSIPRPSPKPLGESWPTYSGDYTGRRYSSLTQINQSNVKHLTLAWQRRLTNGPGPAGPRGPRDPEIIVSGEGDGSVTVAGPTQVKGSILSVNGVLYVTTPDNTWALDANDGHELWHYFWKTRVGPTSAIVVWGCGATIYSS
jgi:alcohol dehydrogenase (cytochrome c)